MRFTFRPPITVWCVPDPFTHAEPVLQHFLAYVYAKARAYYIMDVPYALNPKSFSFGSKHYQIETPKRTKAQTLAPDPSQP